MSLRPRWRKSSATLRPRWTTSILGDASIKLPLAKSSPTTSAKGLQPSNATPTSPKRPSVSMRKCTWPQRVLSGFQKKSMCSPSQMLKKNSSALPPFWKTASRPWTTTETKGMAGHLSAPIWVLSDPTLQLGDVIPMTQGSDHGTCRPQPEPRT